MLYCCLLSSNLYLVPLASFLPRFPSTSGATWVPWAPGGPRWGSTYNSEPGPEAIWNAIYHNISIHHTYYTMLYYMLQDMYEFQLQLFGHVLLATLWQDGQSCQQHMQRVPIPKTWSKQRLSQTPIRTNFTRRQTCFLGGIWAYLSNFFRSFDLEIVLLSTWNKRPVGTRLLDYVRDASGKTALRETFCMDVELKTHFSTHTSPSSQVRVGCAWSERTASCLWPINVKLKRSWSGPKRCTVEESTPTLIRASHRNTWSIMSPSFVPSVLRYHPPCKRWNSWSSIFTISSVAMLAIWMAESSSNFSLQQ